MNDTNAPTFVLHSSRIITPDGLIDGAVTVLDGTITSVEALSQVHPSAKIIDVGNLVVSPGLVDPHVHINEPGRTEWEGFETATRAAAAGGITALVDMPLNSSPVTTSVESFRLKFSSTKGKLYVDCGFHGGLVPENAKNIRDLLGTGILGVKAFLTHSGINEFPNVAEEDLRAAMPAIAERGLPLLVHAELQTSKPELQPMNPQGYSHYLASRPRKWENDAIALMIRLCKEFGCRVHIVHVSSSEAIGILRIAKESGLPITAETCPHYLCFAAEDILDGATQFKCAPPIRERGNNEDLWNALKEGVIDFVASDHSPCPPEMKLPESGDFMIAWGGIASLQFGLSVMWTKARERGFSLADISRWMSANPARVAGLEQKGAIAPSYDADFVIWNPDESFVVTPNIIEHRHKVSPYEGRTLFGKVHTTFVRGQKVFDEGKFNSPSGRILLRK